MPQEPKKRHSKARKRTRRGAIALQEKKLVICSNCQKPKIIHQVCRNCGFYHGRQVAGKTRAQVIKA